MQRNAADARGAGGLGPFEQGLKLAWAVVDSRHQRRDQHARLDARAVELGHRLQTGAGIGRVRLRLTPRLLIERGDRQARGELGALGDLAHQIHIAQQQRRLGQHRARVGSVAQRLPDALHQAVSALDPLVGVRVGPERHVFAPP
jgi:hypothetical protein